MTGRKIEFDLGCGAKIKFVKVKNADVETYFPVQRKQQICICDYDNINSYEYTLAIDNLERVVIAKFSNANSETPPVLEKVVKIDCASFLELLDALLNRNVDDLERKIEYIKQALTEGGE